MTFLEARLVIPSTPNPDGEGRTFDEIRTWHAAYTTKLRRVERYLAETFGGYTVTKGHGVWARPDGELIEESVNVYIVAYESSPVLCGRMDSVRDNVRVWLGQDAVYLSHTVLTGQAVV